TNEISVGEGRRGASAIESRVETGRFRKRETGPSSSSPRFRRSWPRASRRSWGVSTSCHQLDVGRETALTGLTPESRVTAPASECGLRRGQGRSVALLPVRGLDRVDLSRLKLLDR